MSAIEQVFPKKNHFFDFCFESESDDYGDGHDFRLRRHSPLLHRTHRNCREHSGKGTSENDVT